MPDNTIPEFSNCTRDDNGDLWCYAKDDKAVYKVITVDKSTVPYKVKFDLFMNNKKGK